MPSVSSEIIAEITAHMGKFGGEQTHGNTCDQNYHFAGMYRDGETANDYTWFRMYESNLGRWMTPDPLAGDISNPQSLNRYAYVGNNPINFTDPLGLNASDACLDYWPAWSVCNVNPPSAGNLGGWGGWGGGGVWDEGTLGQGQPGVSSLPCGVVYDAPGCSLGPSIEDGIVDIGTIIIVTVSARSPSPNNGTIRALTPQESDDYLYEYCSERGRATFIADWLPFGGPIARRLWSSRLSNAELNRITEENSGPQTVAMHGASEALQYGAGASVFLSRLKAKTGIPKTLASKLFRGASIALIAADAMIGYYQEGKEILGCQGGD